MGMRSFMRSNERRIAAMLSALLLQACRGDARADPAPEQVIKVIAKKWEFTPSRIVLHKGVPVTLELTSADRKHGFTSSELGIRVDVKPNQATRVRVVPAKLGTFNFHCDVFC